MPTQIAVKTKHFTQSVIRTMTRRAVALGAVNLAQGFPDFPAPTMLKEAAKRAIEEDYNQYAVTYGTARLRQAIAAKAAAFNRIVHDPEREITVTCGSTEAMIATLLAVINPGDEVVVFEPYYENYGPDILIAGATPRYVTLREPDFAIDPQELRAAFSARTKAIIVNTPHNPSGKVFSFDELELIAELCQHFDTLAITDEIYEYITYDDARHISLGSLPGMADRTITISGLSKTYSITGWRLAYALAAPRLTGAIRQVHDFLTVCAPHPLQEAGALAMGLPESFYADLRGSYALKRAALFEALSAAGFRCRQPRGAYYIMAEVDGMGFADDVAAANFLLESAGIAAVPGSSFFSRPELGRHLLRFTFSKSEETLRQAAARLALLPDKLRAR
ncbi:MAG TPA: aminotransferase class I/II-fold pyridoxal phosphate-dependent enzyme [Candidatus Binataceae bacterium]|nr:aminotransferase class I/II-fold pyridoxal phosphate-dependent enzyme [Candidatus Binataceae bacterium]